MPIPPSLRRSFFPAEAPSYLRRRSFFPAEAPVVFEGGRERWGHETLTNLIECVLDGYNGTIMANGQTFTGKTYTLGGLVLEKTRRQLVQIKSLTARREPTKGGIGKKIFVGRLPQEATVEDWRHYFGRFGHILDVYVTKFQYGNLSC
ncbi:RNA-binding (RRM/RBD/RNP motifs) family protein [Euphorbia peplus]|nr:RNA-binding (RRM/RBD/RNP motifs) family protein [Euphorbia peplus]